MAHVPPETDAIGFFTSKSANRILAAGGIGSYVLSPANARRCKYAVLCRNARSKDSPRNSEPHRSAFMIGRITDVVPANWRKPGSDRNRWDVLFDEYALLDVPKVWEKRSPVRYRNLEDFGIDPTTLDWKPMPERVAVSGPSDVEDGVEDGMTIEDAKRGLAASFKVPPEAIEITIRM